jgi:two-component system response regulator HydG
VGAQGKLLIADDEQSVRDSLSKWLHEEGCEVVIAENARDALAQLARQDWDAALVDVALHDSGGIRLQRRMQEIDPGLLVIVMTGYASVEAAVAARDNGAYGYVTKPLNRSDVVHLLNNALAHKRANQDNVLLRAALAECARPGDLIGQSHAMRKVLDAIEVVGPTDANVLITGERGTGKELVARAIHLASPRKFHPLVAIHCSGLTKDLLESALFGGEKGAVTGGHHRKKGKCEIAEGGSVFLDEIADISLNIQTVLLRVLQAREAGTIGGNHMIKFDFRCIAATNKDIEKLIEEGKFRGDLFFHLNVFRIELPPLSARRDDIPLLIDHFVEKFSLAMNKPIRRVSPGAMNQLQCQPWVGNVRELENAIERAMIVGQEPELREDDFIFKMPNGAASGKKLEEIERAHILRVLEECGGNQSHAAELLDIDRVTLYHKLKRYGWSRSASKADSGKSDSHRPDEVTR